MAPASSLPFTTSGVLLKLDISARFSHLTRMEEKDDRKSGIVKKFTTSNL
jgi:hypothetical protein